MTKQRPKLKYKKKVNKETTSDIEEPIVVEKSDVVNYDTIWDGKSPKKRPINNSHPNQWTGTVQQERFLEHYLDPDSPTFANPYSSAMEAGYSESYARVIATESVGLQWVKEARNLVSMRPEHVIQKLQKEALDGDNRAADRLRALELIGKSQGMFVDRKLIGHVNLEQALNDLE